MTLSTSVKTIKPMPYAKMDVERDDLSKAPYKSASGRTEKKARIRIPKGVLIYLGISLFCLAFFLVYNLFSHGVTSLYMTFLFAFPLILGAGVIAGMNWLQLPKASFLVSFLYNGGLAAMICSSCIRGITDIAGTYSSMQTGLMIFGATMLSIGVLCYMPVLLSKSEAETEMDIEERGKEAVIIQKRENGLEESSEDMDDHSALPAITEWMQQGKEGPDF